MHQPGDILIDDWGKNCAAWTDAGGAAIKHEGNWEETRTALRGTGVLRDYIDQIALHVARRFTQNDEPQRRAQVVDAIRAGQAPFPLVDLLDIRNQLHVMATTVLPNFYDMAAWLQGQAQELIDAHRGAGLKAID
ncbi:hypothetical protein [Stenotrophomonas sp. AB1(2024)]|uniref:hypothetical protein n=1 Tax=Stenotrophomonas sp. AB1(2024) TaxID=3132215 RepID=UPI0030AE8C66